MLMPLKDDQIKGFKGVGRSLMYFKCWIEEAFGKVWLHEKDYIDSIVYISLNTNTKANTFPLTEYFLIKTFKPIQFCDLFSKQYITFNFSIFAFNLCVFWYLDECHLFINIVVNIRCNQPDIISFCFGGAFYVAITSIRFNLFELNSTYLSVLKKMCCYIQF